MNGELGKELKTVQKVLRYNIFMVNPCFYCDKEALYGGAIDLVEKEYEVIEVCEDHFVFPSAS